MALAETDHNVRTTKELLGLAAKMLAASTGPALAQQTAEVSAAQACARHVCALLEDRDTARDAEVQTGAPEPWVRIRCRAPQVWLSIRWHPLVPRMHAVVLQARRDARAQNLWRVCCEADFENGSMSAVSPGANQRPRDLLRAC